MTDDEAYRYIEEVFDARKLTLHGCWDIPPDCRTICLDGHFTAEELLAFATGLRHAQSAYILSMPPSS